MAREIQKREDLLRDAHALVPRLLVRIADGQAGVDVLAGFRGESLSLYFGDDPAYHFNAAGELRRAFVADRLVKAERGRLVALERRRSADEVILERRDLDEASHRRLLSELTRRVDGLRAALNANEFIVCGQFPPDGDALMRLVQWLKKHQPIAVATSPRIG